MKPLYDIIRLYEGLFRNEHFNTYTLDKKNILSRVAFFQKKGYLKVEADMVTVLDKEKIFQSLNYFGNLVEPLIDTYMITLSTIE